MGKQFKSRFIQYVKQQTRNKNIVKQQIDEDITFQTGQDIYNQFQVLDIPFDGR